MTIIDLVLAPVRLLHRLVGDRRGNVLMLVGFSVIPLTLAAGIAVDYSRAARLQTKLDAAADAAALAGVTAPMMTKTVAEAKTAAQNMFNSQVAGLPGLIYEPADLVVTVTGSSGASIARTVTVTYAARSKNAFAGLIGLATVDIGRTSQASTGISPDIDFYVMMDTSPSMLFPTTEDALTQMKAANGGCAFACHQGNQTPGVDGMRQYNGEWLDSYGIAKKLSWGPGNTEKVVFRYDAMLDAVSRLMSTAYTSSAETEASYRVVINNFDKTVMPVQSLIQIADGTSTFPTANRDAAAAASLTAPLYLPWINGTDKYGNPDNDQQTHFDSMMDALNTSGGQFFIPTAGNGTKVAGDSPQKILFIVSDGFNEQSRYNNPGFGTIDVAKCTALKSRGIKIAILYLWVYPSGWTPGDNQAAPSRGTLAECASPDLYYPVKTGTNITAALSQLFKKAIDKPRLVQ